MGGSESLREFAEQFELVNKKHTIYRKKVDGAVLLPQFSSRTAAMNRGQNKMPAETPYVASILDRHVDRLLLQRWAPTCIVVNDRLEILDFRGNTDLFLRIPPGPPTTSLARVARDGLFSECKSLIENAKKKAKSLTKRAVQIRIRSGLEPVDIEVLPFSNAKTKELLYLILLSISEHASKFKVAKSPRSTGSSAGRNNETVRLRKELAELKHRVRTVLEDHDSALEEAGSAHEEVLSANEELQSLNEEMETGKEELQSTNEELNTLNEELQSRNSELATANLDLSNLLENIGGAPCHDWTRSAHQACDPASAHDVKSDSERCRQTVA